MNFFGGIKHGSKCKFLDIFIVKGDLEYCQCNFQKGPLWHLEKGTFKKIIIALNRTNDSDGLQAFAV